MSATTANVTTTAAPPKSFQQRLIEVTFKKGSGTFATTNSDTVTLSGLRCQATVSQAGGYAQGSLDLKLFGLPESLMNDLSFMGKLLRVEGAGDVVTVTAGTAAGGLGMVFEGTIATAMADYSGAPMVPFHVTSLSAYGIALMSVPPSSYQGGADAAVIMANLAKLMVPAVLFENNGVTGIHLSNPYFPGSPLDQAQACAAAGGFTMAVVDGTLAIWPRGGARGGAVPLISPTTGLVGYPVKTPIGVTFRTLFNPGIKAFGQVQLQSSLPFCSGLWNITQMTHNLDSLSPNGAWFSEVTCLTPLGLVPPATPPAAVAATAPTALA